MNQVPPAPGDIRRKPSVRKRPPLTLGGWDVLASRLRPLPFILGFILSLLVLALAGRWLVNQDIYRDHRRFSNIGHRSGAVQPTAAHLARLIDHQVSPEQIAVIVGGSSISLGIGQHLDDLWTTRLQELLGPRFRVVNLATRGGHANETGMWMAERLVNQGRPVIYVADMGPHVSLKADGKREKSLFYDCLARGFLLPCPEREAAVSMWAGSTTMADLRLGADANLVLAQQDFYSGLAQTRFATIWTPLTGPKPFWTPRGEFPDEEPRVQLPLQWPENNSLPGMPDAVQDDDPPAAGQKASPIPHRAQIIKSLNRIRATIRDAAAQSSLPGADWRNVRYIPPGLRRRLLIITTTMNPGIRPFITADEWALHRKQCADQAKDLAQAGITQIDLRGELTTNDFIDLSHLSASGGRLMADRTAAAIQRLVQEQDRP